MVCTKIILRIMGIGIKYTPIRDKNKELIWGFESYIEFGELRNADTV